MTHNDFQLVLGREPSVAFYLILSFCNYFLKQLIFGLADPFGDIVNCLFFVFSPRPAKFTERPRPGVQMICSSFSAGKLFSP